MKTISMVLFVVCMTFFPIIAHAQKPHFIMNAKNIASWTENKGGFGIQLTEKGKKDLLILSRENLNKPLPLYIGTTLVMSPVVRVPISSGNLYIATDIAKQKKLHDKILSLLPPKKPKLGIHR